jgi:DNA-binding transcriptional regulator GbsR (MarR family)
MPHSTHPIVRRFIEDAGSATQSLGLGRVLGQVYAYLYFSSVPRTLDDLKEALGISKGSASMTVRQLAQWGAVQQVWVKGDRKDYYAANDYFGRIIRSAIQDGFGKRMESLAGLLDEADAALNGNGDADQRFVRQRVQRLRDFQQKASGLWNNPLVKMMMR